MILASHGIVASQIASFDADAVAFFNRVTTAGGSLSLTEKQAVNQLVLDLKANSLWTAIKAIYPMVGASAAACAQNLKSSSFTGTFTSGWTFASTGVTPNGTSAFFNTGLVPLGTISQNSMHLSTYIRVANSGGQIYMGVASPTPYSPSYIFTLGYVAINSSTDSGPYSDFTGQNGFFNNNRTSINNVSVFRNGVNILNDSATSNPPSPNSIYVGAYNWGYTSNTYASNSETAFASIGDGLSNAQASNLYTAVQTFQTTLSRQV